MGDMAVDDVKGLEAVLAKFDPCVMCTQTNLLGHTVHRRAATRRAGEHGASYCDLCASIASADLPTAPIVRELLERLAAALAKERVERQEAEASAKRLLERKQQLEPLYRAIRIAADFYRAGLDSATAPGADRARALLARFPEHWRRSHVAGFARDDRHLSDHLYGHVSEKTMLASGLFDANNQEIMRGCLTFWICPQDAGMQPAWPIGLFGVLVDREGPSPRWLATATTEICSPNLEAEIATIRGCDVYSGRFGWPKDPCPNDRPAPRRRGKR
jgi:hypothetical protein